MIRAVGHDDLEEVAALFELAFRSKTRSAPAGLAEKLGEMFLDHPWVDPEIPSLVHESADGSITGFIGSHVRRLRFDGQRLRLAAGGALVADPNVRNRAVGFLLLREFLAGAQDISLADDAGDATRRMWLALGGEGWDTHSLEWRLVFRRIAYVYDAGSTRLVGRPLRPRYARHLDDAGDGLEVLHPDTLVRELPRLTHARIRPDYDREFATWLFEQLAHVRERGTLIARILQDDDDRPRGWFIYYALPGGRAEVVHFMAAEDATSDVFSALLRDARARGATCLSGLGQRDILYPISQAGARFRFRGNVLVHAREPEIERALLAGDAAISRLEGESWMGLHLESFG